MIFVSNPARIILGIFKHLILTKGLKEKDHEITELRQQVASLEDKINDLYLIIKNKEQQLRHDAELNNDIIQEMIEE
jgi:hypothetical protein